MEMMAAQLVGKLILVDGCPRAEVSDGSSILLFWRYNYTIDRSVDPAQIRDDTGKVVAHIGDYVEMGGGNAPDSTEKKLRNGCAGPIWVAGEGPRVLNPSFPEEIGVGGFSMTDVLKGKLVLVNGCLRLQTSDNKSFLLLWLSGQYHREQNPSEVHDIRGIRAQVGDKIKAKGGEVTSALKSAPGDITKPLLAQPLPKACATGPYWVVNYIEK